MKTYLLLSLMVTLSINALSQCDDGQRNNTEYFEDCGGLFCNAACSIGPNIPTTQRHFYHKQISFEEAFYEVGNIAVSDKGSWMVWSSWDVISGERRIYSKPLNQEAGSFLIHERQVGDGTLSTAHVDISDDGSLILFSFGSKIYVCDLDGGNKIVVLEEVATSAGNWDLSLKSPPQFAPGNVPDKLYFVQVEFGGLNGTGPLAAGLWTASTNQKTTGEQLFNAEDVAMLYGEDRFSYTPEDGIYGPLISDNNEILFGTRDYSASGYSDLWLYHNGSITEITKFGPPGFTFSAAFSQMDMSSDGSTICWMNGVDHSYNTLNRYSGLVNKFKNLGLGNDNMSLNFTGSMRTNHDGTLFFLQGSSNTTYNTALVTYNGNVHYPLAISKFASAPTQKVRHIEMKKESGDMIYYSSNEGNVWMSEFEKYIFQLSHPEITATGIRHILKENYNGPPYANMKVFAGVEEPYAPDVEYVSFMELDDPLKPINHLNNAPTSELFDDGITYGDAAVDGFFSSNYVWPTFEEYNSDSEDTITLRIVAGNETFISSIDVYPIYILDQALMTHTNDHEIPSTFKIVPNFATDEIWIDVKDQNISKIDGLSITNNVGQLLQKIPLDNIIQDVVNINIADLTAGMYFINLETEGEILTKKFVKL